MADFFEVPFRGGWGLAVGVEVDVKVQTKVEGEALRDVPTGPGMRGYRAHSPTELPAGVAQASTTPHTRLEFPTATCTSSLQRPSPFVKHSQPPPPHLIFLLALGLSVSGDKGGLPEPNARPLSTLPEAALLSSPNNHHNGTDAGNSTHEANEMHEPSHIA